MMETKVIVQRFALVDDGYDSYRVYENGMIDCWYVECGWMEYCGASHEKIREAGLKALVEHR